jgi:hypothetical protein
VALQSVAKLEKITICCLPAMLLIAPAVDVVLNPVVGANCANSVAMLALVIVAA